MPLTTEVCPQVEFMPWGNLAGFRIEGERVPFETSVRAVRPDWRGFTQSSKYNWEGEQVFTRDGEAQEARHGLQGLPIAYAVHLREDAEGGVELQVQVEVLGPVDLAGIYFCLALPGKEFAGGELRWIDPVVPGSPGGLLPIPGNAGQPLPRKARGVTVRAAGCAVSCTGDSAGTILLRQDHVHHPAYLNDPKPRLEFVAQDPLGHPADYQFYFPLLAGPQRAGTKVVRTFQLRATATVERSPLQLTLDPSQPGRPFTGIGGNFRLQFPEQDRAVVAHCLDHLRVTWGRIALYWRDWHPEENEDPVQRAEAGGLAPLIRGQMELAATLARRGIPLIVSVWDPPRWAAEPWPNGERGEALRPDKLEAIADSLAGYLTYLKRNYGAEAELFSFNETDVGVEVRETPEQHARHARVLGRKFAESGLQTRMLLGDTGHGTAAASRLVSVALEDPAARRYAGAIAFHTYHGCTQADLAAWTAAARQLNLPLLVTEGGLDSAAHRYPAVFQEPWFARQEIDTYVRIAEACQPAAILPWQLTSDYSVLAGGGIYGDHGPLRPTQRFWNLKQLGATPAGASWLPVRGLRPQVSAAGFGHAGRGVYGVHLVNNGAARSVTLRGLPLGVRTARAWCTDGVQGMEEMAPLAVSGGVVGFTLPAGAFLSLFGET